MRAKHLAAALEYPMIGTGALPRSPGPTNVLLVFFIFVLSLAFIARRRGLCLAGQVWQGLLAVRSLVLPMKEESEAWTKFASLLQKSGRTRQSNRTLLQLLGCAPPRA